MKTLVLGVGNPILGDDGVGIHVIRELRKKIKDVDFDEVSVSGLELVELFRGYDKVIIVDAIKTKQGIPGEIRELTLDNIPTLHGITPHDVDFKTAFEYGKRFIDKMPDEVRIIGIEVDKINEFDEKLSAKVSESIPKAAKLIKEDLLNGS
ncbi:MAG: hypothetical protein B6U97_01745 [Candidatus Altiarchaeales archaeon ex4484_96]|nr:MAG: hypothetical protein B6U97_01745 [Candidatus Altiarchaeales archaeon ex4484_96]